MAERRFRVVVAGAGVSGLFMAETLKRAGIDFTVYEKAGEVGGTWRDNTFPGLFVDVLSRQYEFPFQPNYDWSRKYAPADEIWAYIKKVARDRGLHQASSASTRRSPPRASPTGAGRSTTAKGRTDVADVFVCATGFLHKPLFPDIAGRDSFAGPSFHSARWDHGVPYEGKRWGVIGSGASGVQITEALAWAGVDVTQFIRRAQWVHIRENPHSTWQERLKLRLPGGYRREQRRLWQFINEFDHWRLKPGPQREAMEREYRSYLDIIQDPELKAEADARLQSRLHPHPEIGQELLRGGAAAERANRQGTDRPYRAGRRRDGGRRQGRARRAGLRHRLRCPRLYAPDAGDGPQRRHDRRRRGRSGSIPMAASRCRASPICSCFTARSRRSTTCRCRWASTRRSAASCG